MNPVGSGSGQCNTVRSYLDSYLSKELMAEASLGVRRHLEYCEDCARALDDRARIKDKLKCAVLNVQPTESLLERIRVDIHRASSFHFKFTFSRMLAAAAAVVVAVTLGNSLRHDSNSGSSNARPLSLIAEVEPADTAGQILKVGFDDHVACAIDHGMANKRFTTEEMSAELGPKYDEVLEVPNGRMARDFEIVVGHRCHHQNREFVHLIIRRRQQVVSLIVTQKNGEAFPTTAGAAAIKSGGIPVHEASWHNIHVAGFETSDHLAFVISNGEKRENELIASSLVPAIEGFLSSIEI